MIHAKTRTQFDAQRVKQKAKTGEFRGLSHAAAAIRLTAKRSLRKKKGPAPVGAPPHTQTRRLPKAIVFFVDKIKAMALIGTSRRIVGIAGAEHEHGGRWRRETFPKRPFMGPALRANEHRLAKHWAGSIG